MWGKVVSENVEKIPEDVDETLLFSLPSDFNHIPLNFTKRPPAEILRKSEEFYNILNKRRTVRHFSTEKVPKEVIANIIRAAGTAPSGAHTEPWTYVVVSSLEIKEKIRHIIEEEEEINYKKRMGQIWTSALKPLNTDWVKPYLTEAPFLILAFKQMYSVTKESKKRLHYYNEQSICISIGMLLAAVQYAGLASLVSTPMNCGPALRILLGRPSSEKLCALLPVGFPADDCLVPELYRKSLADVMVEF